MQYIQIRFLEWRERSQERESAAQRRLAELADLIGTKQSELARLRRRDERLVSGAVPAQIAKFDALRAAIDVLEEERDKITEAEVWRARELADAALKHRRVGTTGYQVVDANMAVVRIVDERGENLPVAAVYSSDVVDASPPRPVWADEKEAIWSAYEAPARS